MPAKTKIEWADYISNPIKAEYTSSYPMNGGHPVTKRGHACVKISEGCAHCWASTFNVRLGTGLEYTVSNLAKAKLIFDDKEYERMKTFRPRGPFKNDRDRAVVFPCDMTDLFGDWVPWEWQEKMYNVFDARRDVDWFVLTKRPGAMKGLWSEWNVLPNVYLGTSIENDRRAVERLEPMRRLAEEGWNTWVSYEPALGEVNWFKWDFLKVLMCGGESGMQARPMHPNWAALTMHICKAYGIKYFFKQWGEWVPIDQLDWVTEQTTFKSKPIDFQGARMVRVGKGMAGHKLYGIEYKEMP